MFRFLKIAVPAFLLGSIFGAAFWYLASPLWIDRVVSETLIQSESDQVLATGSFSGVDGVHQAKGAVTMVQMPDGSVQLQFADFEVTNGPDLKIWLISHPKPDSATDVKSSEQLKLGPLKGNIGNQFYTLPADSNAADFHSVVVYCQQFSFMFASAPLS